jgi:hypothetical protein
MQDVGKDALLSHHSKKPAAGGQLRRPMHRHGDFIGAWVANMPSPQARCARSYVRASIASHARHLCDGARGDRIIVRPSAPPVVPQPLARTVVGYGRPCADDRVQPVAMALMA